jgi:hypothetical protein
MGLHDKAWALITLQICLAALNVRGVRRAKDESETTQRAKRPGESPARET